MTATEPISPPVAKRHRLRGWLIALAILVALIAAGLIVGEQLARNYATTYVHDKLVAAFHLPASEPVQVKIGGGSLLLQAATGRINSVEASIPKLAVGGIEASLRLRATGIPLDSSKPATRLSAVVSIDEANVQKLKSYLGGVSVSSITLGNSLITVSSSLNIFGFAVPVSVSLAPSVSDGELAFTANSVSINGAKLSLADLKNGPFAGAATAVLPQQKFCVAQYLPRALTLTSATVENKSLVVTLGATNIALGSSAFSENGQCPSAG